MEGDSSKAPSSWSDVKAPNAASSSRSKETSCKRDVIHMERDRRERMTEYYTMLQAMVPNLFPKATRTRIIDETISYIRTLEEVNVALHAEKASREMSGGQVMFRTKSSPSIEVRVSSGHTVCFGVCFTSRPGMLTRVLEVMEENKAEVLTASVVCKDQVVNMNVTVVLQGEESLDTIKEQLSAL